MRRVLSAANKAASVVWYRHWHEEFLYQALRRELSQLGEAVVYAQGPEAARAALRARLGPHQQVVMAVHFSVSHADAWASKKMIRDAGQIFWSIRKMERDVISALDGLVYVSKSAREQLLSWLPEAASITSAVIPNFVGPPQSVPCTAGTRDLVSIGSLDYFKNHRYLLEVLAEAQNLGRTASLDIFGTGPLRNELARLATKLRLEGQVRLMGARPDARNVLRGYKVYVHASVVETSSLAIIESMAAGLPILSGAVGGIAELFTDGIEGRFWPLDDAHTAASILVDLLDSNEKRAVAGAAARERYRHEYSADAVGPRLEHFLLEQVPGQRTTEAAVLPLRLPQRGVPTEKVPYAMIKHTSHPRLQGRRSATVVLDGRSLTRTGRGVSRLIRHLVPLLAKECKDLGEVVTLMTEEGRELLGPIDGETVLVPTLPTSVWEQFGLPEHSRRVSADVIYTHSECGPLWGPPVLLHIPEDPYVRWKDAPAGSLREHTRRTYQRLVVSGGIRRAPMLVTSSKAVADDLERRLGPEVVTTAIVPLGVDRTIFYPEETSRSSPAVFHLGSCEPRDQSALVVRAYAEARLAAPDMPDLLIAGDLGDRASPVRAAADETNVSSHVHLLGRLSDDDLRYNYSSSAMCIQPARYEGFGLQPLEALACGVPLIVFAEPAVQEVVGDAAVVLADRSVAALANAMAQLWADAERREQLRSRGPQRAQTYSWEETARKLHDLLVVLCNDPCRERAGRFSASRLPKPAR